MSNMRRGKIGGIFFLGVGVKIFRKGGKLASGSTIVLIYRLNVPLPCVKDEQFVFVLHSVIFVFINTMKTILIPFKLLNSMDVHYLLTK